MESENFNVDSWMDVVALPGISLFLFALCLTAVFDLKSWRKIFGLSLVMLLALTVSIMSSVGDVFTITEKQSALYSIVIVLFSAILSMALHAKPIGKLWMVLAAVFGVVYGLNEKILNKPFYQATTVWKDGPMLILKVTAGFVLTFFILQLLIWLVQTAFTVKDRDRQLVVSGGAIGAACVLLYQLLTSY